MSRSKGQISAHNKLIGTALEDGTSSALLSSLALSLGRSGALQLAHALQLWSAEIVGRAEQSERVAAAAS